LNNKPVEVIYNGCFVNTEERFSTKPEFINKNDQFLFSIGTIASKKNFHVLPALLKGNDFKLVISGVVQDQDYYNKIIFEAKRHHVEDRLILSGPITEAEKWWLMKHTSGFLFPSIAEGFGIPVVEAMNFGIPILLSTQTSLPEIGQNAAYYFTSFNPDSMQQILKDSLSHFENEKNQKNIVLKRGADFNWTKSAEAYMNIYKLLANN
jgi:glycosyltransferase involved in cell wall biosynthesis